VSRVSVAANRGTALAEQVLRGSVELGGHVVRGVEVTHRTAYRVGDLSTGAGEAGWLAAG
jgi:hypothetical protein